MIKSLCYRSAAVRLCRNDLNGNAGLCDEFMQDIGLSSITGYAKNTVRRMKMCADIKIKRVHSGYE